MKVVVSGGTGVIGRAAVPALVADGHEVTVLTRSDRNKDLVQAWGARPFAADILDPAGLDPAFTGADAVVNLATHIPIGWSAMWPGAWRENDRLRTVGVRNVVEAAHRVGVRRVVQESVSFVYADSGDGWITEADPIEITDATEPVAVAESAVQSFADQTTTGVVLRFGQIVGDDPMTRFWLRGVRRGRPVGLGRPDGWVHLIHTDDLGTAVRAAMHAPSGVYNVGATPARRDELVSAFAQRVGLEQGRYLTGMLTRLAGGRIEPLTRSLRISSDRFISHTGWTPVRPAFDPDWLEVCDALQESR